MIELWMENNYAHLCSSFFLFFLYGRVWGNSSFVLVSVVTLFSIGRFTYSDRISFLAEPHLPFSQCLYPFLVSRDFLYPCLMFSHKVFPFCLCSRLKLPTRIVQIESKVEQNARCSKTQKRFYLYLSWGDVRRYYGLVRKTESEGTIQARELRTK